MLVNGGDCTIVIKTSHYEKDIPFSDETIREAISILPEEAPIEGDGICKGIRKVNGVTGCVVSPLTIGTAPLLLYLAMGAAGSPLYVSETKNLYKYQLNLLPMPDTEHFYLIQDRKNERLTFDYCRVIGFELRILRDEAIKLKLDITSWCQTPKVSDTMQTVQRETGERFSGNCVTYTINGKEYKNIYGVTLVSKKQGGTKTEIWIKRALQKGDIVTQSLDIPTVIDELIITAQLLRDNYEYRYFGMFRITVKKLVLISDETEVNASGAVISPRRFYVAGGVSAEVFTNGEEIIP